MAIKVVLVDDEPIAIRGLMRHLQVETDLEIVATCGDGASAIEAINQLQPDLIFLDIKMPELSGFDVIQAIGLQRMPAVIFVTAFDEFAVKAFEVHAIGYILKPIDSKRLQLALNRARQNLFSASGKDHLINNISAALADIGFASPSRWSKRLAIRTTGRINLVETKDIDRIEAAGNYVEIHIAAKSLLMRETLTSLEARLDPTCFVRISRSTIININSARELQPMFNGDFVVILKNGSQASGSRRYREQLNNLLGQ
ncbi:LytTR family DNA-binding domain-containing protein [Paraglaciecola sp.]|uniref:LytR/AlgR family response regulator transcription factor n=1 Tax=Paraglaciecola sp. TaxID=1920173 RepID=UPI0030F3AFB3